MHNLIAEHLMLTAVTLVSAAGSQQPPVKLDAETRVLAKLLWSDESRKPDGPPKPGIATIYLKKLATGGYHTEPGNMPHFASSEDGATVGRTSNGPSAVKFVKPADLG